MTPKILIVDDDDRIRGVVKKFLDNSGFSVDETSAADEAFRMLTMGEYDAVIMDLNMPGTNGLEGIRAIKLIKEDQCIVVLTGYSSDQVRKEAEEAGACAVLIKPVNMETLAKTMREVLGVDASE